MSTVTPLTRIWSAFGTAPRGCSCEGCCRVMGWDGPKKVYNIYGANSTSKHITLLETYDREEWIRECTKLGLETSDTDFCHKYFSSYKDELTRVMTWLGQKSDTIFMGQAVRFPGTSITETLSGVPKEKLIEQPVMENTQTGIATGFALNGFVPILIHPRWNFLILATDQIVNHLDKLKAMSNGGYQPKVIIRVGVGSRSPLDPQEQHKSNFSTAFRKMLTNIEVIELEEPEDIIPAYQRAYERTDGKSTIISEFSDYYHQKGN